MDFNTVRYNEFGLISVIVDGVVMSVPDDLSNRHRQMIAEWEEKGNIIPPYITPKPSTDPNDYPLNRFQFEALTLSIGLSIGSLETAINSLPITAFDKAVALSRLRNAVTFNRDHPLVEQVRSMIKMSVADLDKAWMQAKDLR